MAAVFISRSFVVGVRGYNLDIISAVRAPLEDHNTYPKQWALAPPRILFQADFYPS